MVLEHEAYDFESGYALQRLFRFHNLFQVDHLAWLLLPEDSIVDKYWDSLKFSGRSAKRERFPNFPERKTFLYKFVPLDGMEFVIINYRDTIPEDRARDHSNFTSYFHPFDKLQPLESHLHPKFVIYNARLKLDRVLDSESTLVESFEKFPSLLKILDLYRAWTRERPSNALEDLSYNDPSDPSATTVMTLKTVTTVLEPIEPSAGVWGIGPLRFLRKGCLDLISNSGKLLALGQITASASGQERRENLALPLIYPCPHSFFILNLHKYQFKI